MKRNRILTTLLIVCMSLLLAFGLTACGDKPCSHTYDNACDITCNECGEERTVTHIPNADDGNCLTAITCQNCSEVLTAARSEHEANADDGDCTTSVTCKHCTTVLTEAKSAHEAGEDDGDCTTDIICKHCEQVAVAGNASHNPNADDGNCLTAITCSVCGTVTTPARDSHTGGTATCTEKAVCTACGTAYGAIDVNNHIDENTDHICDRECGKTDIGTHADSAEDNDHVCDYGCKAILEDHKGGTATCVAQKVCTICGNGYGDLENHDFGSGNTCICGAEIAFTGFIYISDEIYTYDESTNTYTVIIPPNYYGADAKFHITGKNLEYLESDNALLKVKENHSLVGEYDFLLEDFLNTGFEVGWGSMRDGSWLEYQYSNDGGITWSKAVRAEVKQSYYVTVNASENGTVTANEYAIEGETVTLNVSPAEGYMLDTLSVTDASGNTIVVENNQFTMPASAVIVNATFAVCDHKDSRHETATDNGDGTHSFTCTVCGVTGTENHTIENHVCTACGAMEIVVSFDAGDYEWKTGDQIKIERIVGYDAEYYTYTASVDENGITTWTPDKKLYWDGEEDHILAAFYPAAGQDDYRSFELPEDQSTLEKLKLADCMNAVWVGNPTTDPINFQMKHRLSMVTVNYAIASEYTNAIVDNVRVIPSDPFAMFDAKDGGKMDEPYGVFGTTIDAYHDAENKTIQAIVIPCTYPEGQVFMKISVNGEELQVKMPEAKTLEEGGEYTFDVKVGQDVIRIEEVSMGDIDSPFGDGWHNEIDLRAIGTQDVGKTAWENGDQIIVTFTSLRFGTQYGTLTYDGSWSTDVSFSYLENETPTVSAIYAPCYEVADGNMQLKDGMQLGMTEYISAACSITDGTLNISFEGVTRNYSRLRISTLPDQTLTVTTTGFTPAGATAVANDVYTFTADENGNIYLYGTFAVGATVSVKQGEVSLADYAFTADKHPEGTKPGITYALDARPIIDGTLGGKTESTEDDINALVEQLKAYVDNGITTIIVTGSNPAMIDMDSYSATAIGEAIYRLSGSDVYDENNTYNGKIDLILSDVTEIVEWEFYNAFALNSITLPKVTAIGDQAFQGCDHLKQITFGSVVTSIAQINGKTFVVGDKVGGCNLVLNAEQANAATEYLPNVETKTWWNTEWKSITLK